MAAELQILIGGEALDLFFGEEEKFYITKQLYDLRNLETRNASFSRTINIPKTPTNLLLLGDNLPSKARFDDTPYHTIECDVLVSGVPMITEAYLLVGVEDVRQQTVSITVYGGTAKFFNELSTDSIRDLSFSEYNIEWTLAGVSAILLETTGICYANAQWYTNPSRRLYDFNGNSDDAETYMNTMELGESGLFIFIKTVMDKIWSNMPLLTIDDSQILAEIDPQYEKLAMPFSVPVIHDSFGRVDGSYTEVQNNTYPLPVAPMFVILPFPTIIENTSGFWVVANTRFEFTADGFFRVTFQANGTYKNNDGIDFWIYKNGLFVASGSVGPTSGGSEQPWDVAIETTVNVVNTDYVDCRYRIQTPALAEADIITSQFIIEQEGSGRPPNINVSSLLPDISQRDFVKQVFNSLGIVPAEVAGVVELSLFENIRTAPRTEEIQFDTSRGVKIVTSLPRYGRLNNLKYADNAEVEREDVDDTFAVNSLALQKESTAINLTFSACDEGVSMVNKNGRCVIPNYDLEYNFVNDNKMSITTATFEYTTADRNDIAAGDFVSYLDGGTWIKRRVNSIDTDTNGFFDVVAPSTNNSFDWHHWRYNAKDIQIHLALLDVASLQAIQDGGLINATQNQKIAKFEESQKWANLKLSHFKLITDSLYKPFAFEAWAIIPVVKFANLNELDVIYVEEFAAYFYINVIEQWKPNQLCRVTLIEIKL